MIEDIQGYSKTSLPTKWVKYLNEDWLTKFKREDVESGGAWVFLLVGTAEHRIRYKYDLSVPGRYQPSIKPVYIQTVIKHYYG